MSDKEFLILLSYLPYAKVRLESNVISKQLGNIDSDGKYIGIKTEGFSLTNIQCYIKTDEQKQIIMELSRGDTIVIKGYCKDIGEILGYQIDINEIIIP